MPPSSGAERRQHVRRDVTWPVDCTDGENFLYSYITNISEMGIFISTRNPPEAGSSVSLKFDPPGEASFALEGLVTWVNPVRADGDNPNPGFGVQFTNLSAELRERLVSLVHAIAYLPDDARVAT